MCGVCKESKESIDFYKHHNTHDGLQTMCKQCSTNRRKRYYQENIPRKQELQKANHLSRKYNLTVVQFELLKTQQENVCAICKREPDSGRYKGFYVDHDHRTGKVRGLLCYRCNMVLGYAKEDLDVLQTAIHYLKISHVTNDQS